MTDKLSTDFRANFSTDENPGYAECTGKGKIIQINQDMIRQELGDLVKGTVEETLNTLLDEEADRLCGAKRYERNAERKDYRCGKREQKLQTKAGSMAARKIEQNQARKNKHIAPEPGKEEEARKTERQVMLQKTIDSA